MTAQLPTQTLLKHRFVFFFVLGLFVGTGLLVFHSGQVWAQSPEFVSQSVSSPTTVSLMAIPDRLGDDLSLEVSPGETVQLSVRVRNTSDKAQLVKSVVRDFIIGEDGKTPVPVQENTDSRWSLASWIELPIADNQVPAGSTQTVPIIVHVPTDALPGGRYAMILHELDTGAGAQTTGGQAEVSSRVGTLLYIRVAGQIQESASVRNLTLPHLVEFGPIPISFEVDNLSDVHIKPSIRIIIRDMIGREQEVIPVETHNVFPYSQRLFQAQWDRVWGFGYYHAQIEMTYGSTSQAFTLSQGFWMIPYKLVLTVLIVFITLVAMIIAVRRHLRHRSDESQQHIELLEEKLKQLESELQNHQR